MVQKRFVIKQRICKEVLFLLPTRLQLIGINTFCKGVPKLFCAPKCILNEIISVDIPTYMSSSIRYFNIFKIHFEFI